MFSVYLYEGKEIKGSFSEKLVKEAALAFGREYGIPMEGEETLRIERKPGGKPFFPQLPIEFNVSHSGLMWICMMGFSPCGIDIQEIKDCAYKKIAARYFSREEQSFVFRKGLESFFSLWVRREAVGKYTGRGFFDPQIPSLIREDGSWNDSFIIREKQVYLKELEFTSYLKCAYCSEEEKNEIQIFG